MHTKIPFKQLLLFCLAFLFLIVSCSDNKIKIALMLGNMKAARWQKDKEYFINEAQKLGCEGIVVDANFDEALQVRQAEELIDQGVKVILLAAINSNTGGEIVRYAYSKGVKTIAYDSYIANCPLYAMVSFDNVKVGSLMAEYAVNKLKEGGDYMILGGDKSNLNAVQIVNGQLEVLSKHKCNVVYKQYMESWSREDAYMAVKAFLNMEIEKRPVAILGANDNIADGAITAYEELGIPLPIFTGQDASLLGCKNIYAGKQTLTIYKSIRKLANISVTVAYDAARNKKVDKSIPIFQDVPAYYVDVIPVDKDNIESTVISDGFQTKDEIASAK